MEPSSADKGFFQSEPTLRPQFESDPVYQRGLKLFLPHSVHLAVSPELSSLSRFVLHPQVFSYVTSAEAHPPSILGDGRSAFGAPQPQLLLSSGWQHLQSLGLQLGFIATGYQSTHGPYQRLVQFSRLLLWEASAANTTCPGAMQDGAARLLQLHLEGKGNAFNGPDGKGLDESTRAVLQDAFDRLTSTEPGRGWTSGQWMTERPGGSDVSKTETIARYDPLPVSEANGSGAEKLGPYRVDGFKWFSSATDSNMAILLAQLHDPETGEVKLSAFYAPMRLPSPSSSSLAPLPPLPGPSASTLPLSNSPRPLNGITISRLKRKLGTVSLPTAELSLHNLRAHLLGPPGSGIAQVSPILTLTRIHSAIGNLGYLGRGLQIARAFSLVRSVGSGKGRRQPLWQAPLHVRTLSSIAAGYHGSLLLALYTIWVLGLDERGLPSPSTTPSSSAVSPSLSSLTPKSSASIAPLLRILTPLLKASVCLHTQSYLQSCMESLGGVGYLLNSESEHLNIARLVRDGMVNSIWEGTTDVLSTDTVRVLKHPKGGKQSLAALDSVIREGLGSLAGTWDGEKQAVLKEWTRLLKIITKAKSHEELLPNARDITLRTADILMAMLLLVDANSDGVAEPGATCRKFLVAKGFLETPEMSVDANELREGYEMDLRIVFGKDEALQMLRNVPAKL